MARETKHLWEVEHDYYCNEGNYFTNKSNVHDHHKTWADFDREYRDSDFDMNLVFRWDWHEGGEDGDGGWGGSKFTGDVNYRNGYLQIFWMGQRKGLYRYSTIEVCRADEPAVIAFLQPRWEHLRKMWEPIAADGTS